MKWIVNIRLLLLQALALGMLTVFTVQLVDSNVLTIDTVEEMVECDSDVEDSSEEEEKEEQEDHKVLLIFENRGMGAHQFSSEFYYQLKSTYSYQRIDSPPPELG